MLFLGPPSRDNKSTIELQGTDIFENIQNKEKRVSLPLSRV